MGIAPHGGVLSIRRDVDAPIEAVWGLLVDVGRWPQWGPSVRRAVLDGGATELALGVRGTVWTAVGVPMPFATGGQTSVFTLYNRNVAVRLCPT